MFSVFVSSLHRRSDISMCLFLGPFAVLSIMVGSVVEQLAPDQKFLIMNGTNLTNIVDEAARDSYRVKVAATTTVLGGVIQVSM